MLAPDTPVRVPVPRQLHCSSDVNYCCVRGELLTKGPDSSFAEAYKGFNSEPIHMEDKVKDQEVEVEDGRDK